MGTNAGTSLLEIERDRLKGSVDHLQRSVEELKAAIAETGPDQDYKEAINENVVLIAKTRARIAALDDEIKRSRGVTGDISMCQLATVPVSDVDMNVQQPEQQQEHGILSPPTAASELQQQQQQQQPPQQTTPAGTGAHAMVTDDGQGQPPTASEIGLWL